MDEDMIFVQGCQPYSYDRHTHFGTLHFYDDNNIFVDVQYRSMSPTEFFQRSRAHTLVHKNILPCLWLDVFVDSNILVYRRFATTFREHMINHKTIVSPYTIPTQTLPPKYWTCHYLEKDYRRFFRGAIEAIVYIHEQGYSLSTLTLDENLAIYKDNLVLYRLATVDDCSPIAMMRDFGLLATVFENILGGQEQPYDVEYLIHLMRRYSPGDEYLLINHISLLTTDKKICAINNFHKNHGIVGHRYHNIIAEMAAPRDWPQSLIDPELYPGLGVVYDCYLNKSSHRGSNQPAFNINEIVSADSRNYTAIKFCRDMTAHISDHIYKHKRYVPGQLGCYTKKDVELTIMCAFGDILCEFQRAAHVCGLLEHFMSFD